MKMLSKLILVLSFALTTSLSYADGGLIFLEKNQERNVAVQANDANSNLKCFDIQKRS